MRSSEKADRVKGAEDPRVLLETLTFRVSALLKKKKKEKTQINE